MRTRKTKMYVPCHLGYCAKGAYKHYIKSVLRNLQDRDFIGYTHIKDEELEIPNFSVWRKAYNLVRHLGITFDTNELKSTIHKLDKLTPEEEKQQIELL